MTKDEHEVAASDESTKELRESIASLEEQIATVNSKRMVFVRGLVAGVGRAVGATILFAVIIGGLSTLLYQLGWFPEFNQFLSSFIPGQR
jgi:hypothetical protein